MGREPVVKRPWKDMEFSAQELFELESSGRRPRDPTAHPREIGPRGWLAPPSEVEGEDGSSKAMLEELDATVDVAFESVQKHPAKLVQWLDENILVTDHGLDGRQAKGVGAPSGAAVSPPPAPEREGAVADIHVDIEVDGPVEDETDQVDVALEADAGGASAEQDAVVDQGAVREGASVSDARPASVDAVFRALVGPQPSGRDAVPEVDTAEESLHSQGKAFLGAEAVSDGSEGLTDERPDAARTIDDEEGAEVYEPQDAVSGAVPIPAEIAALSEDDDVPTVSDVAAPDMPSAAKTMKVPVAPTEASVGTIRMTPPPPPPPPPPSVAQDGAAVQAGTQAVSAQVDSLDVDVDLDSLSDVPGPDLTQASAQETPGAVADQPEGDVASAAAEQTAETADDVAVQQGADERAEPSIAVPSESDQEAAGAAGPEEGKAAPPPVPATDKAAPPPVPAIDKTAPPPVPEVDKVKTPPPVPAGQVESGASEQAEAKAAEARPPRPPDAVRKKPWYQDFFDDDYLPTLPFETPESTVKEVEFLLTELAIPEEGRVLDLGCGYGRHAVEIAGRGYSVVGLDNSLPMLIKAAELSQFRGVEVDFVQEDMRQMAFDEEFDAMYCFGTTFGYFGDDENRDLLKRMNRALKQEGRLVLEVVNRDFLLADLPLRVWWEGEGCLVMEEVDFNYFTSRVEAHRTVVFNDGRQIERTLSIRVYSLHELGMQLFQSGFRVLKITGHLATRGRFFGMHSPHLIVTAVKK